MECSAVCPKDHYADVTKNPLANSLFFNLQMRDFDKCLVCTTSESNEIFRNSATRNPMLITCHLPSIVCLSSCSSHIFRYEEKAKAFTDKVRP